jgi:DNA helicase-2/ATP-dependent DNA helicase PcrA
MAQHADYAEETGYLRYVAVYMRNYLAELEKQKAEIDTRVEYSLKHYNSDNPEQFTELTLNTEQQDYLSARLAQSRRAVKKPYFTRVDFTADGERTPEKLYIGKMSLRRVEDNNMLVVDWRAPISNLYYDGRIGRAGYVSPEGRVTGDLLLKRQYIIEDSELTDFFDIDITANDDFLQAALASSKDERLKDIVSTIQKEQNRVIRADMLRPLIVQGAAGSGKTTIALHRIAFLLYNYEKTLRPKNIMILAPNRFFISYISEVLPDLGVENVLQTTLADFTAEFIDEKLNPRPASGKLNTLISRPAPEEPPLAARISAFKSSLDYKDIIDAFLDKKIRELVPRRDFLLGGQVLLTHAQVLRILLEDYAFLPVEKRVKELRKYLTNALNARKPGLMEDAAREYDSRAAAARLEYPADCEERRLLMREIYGERDALLAKLTKESKSLVRDYLKAAVLKKTTAYYKELTKDEELFRRPGLGAESEAARKETAALLSKNIYEDEDMAALIHLHYIMRGNEYYDLRHVVIDEAQDMSVFQMAALREVMRGDSFTILGDLCQGIYSYKGIQNWRQVTEDVFGGKADYTELEQSYRTTVEIMNYANTIISKLDLGVPAARPVIRHGEPVTPREVRSRAELAEAAAGELKRLKALGCKSIAIITKTPEESESLLAAISARISGTGMPAPALLCGSELEYRGGVVILPAHLSKGLEFDGVIIAGASEANWGESELELKLLYIAATRALHYLVVLFCVFWE